MSIALSWPANTWIRRTAIVALRWWVLLIPITGVAQVHIVPQSAANPETAALVQRVRDELAAVSHRVAALDVRVTIGAAEFRKALIQDDKRPLVAAYLTSTEFEAALEGRERPPHVTAVFSNPDPLDQVALAQTLLGRPVIGVFDSPAAHSLVARIAASGVQPIPVSAGQGIDSLLRTADSLDAIIVLPDSSVLNRSNINHVVRTLYQRRKVLIGYSVTLARIGSLASVYVSPEAMARSVADVLERYAAGGTLPNPVFVRDVDVVINDRLARSLNIALPDRTALLRGVRSRKEEKEATP